MVGPIYNSDRRIESIKVLKLGIKNLLMQCELYGYKSVAVPAISAGIFGFPKHMVA